MGEHEKRHHHHLCGARWQRAAGIPDARAATGVFSARCRAIVSATAVAAPAAPTNVTATAGNAGVTLGWADPSNSDITKYQYRQRTPPGSGTWGNWTDFTGGTTATSTSGTVTGSDERHVVRVPGARDGGTGRDGAGRGLVGGDGDAGRGDHPCGPDGFHDRHGRHRDHPEMDRPGERRHHKVPVPAGHGAGGQHHLGESGRTFRTATRTPSITR